MDDERKRMDNFPGMDKNPKKPVNLTGFSNGA
jgi:hypothetical protein